MENSVTDKALPFVDMFEASEQATDEARQTSERCRDYYDSKQLTEAEVAELKRRGQPIIVDNVIAGKINWMLGQEMNRRTDPKAFPRTPQHQQGAEAVTDALRFVCERVDWDEKRSQVWENMLIEGVGGAEVVHKQTKRGIEIAVNHYSWDRLFWDPHSRRHDFSDAQYLGAVIWSDRKVLERKYPKHDFSGVMNAGSTIGETYEDRPNRQIWGDKERNRVRVVLMYYREGDTWKWVKFSYGVILEEGESMYVDDEGMTVCPLIMQSAYVDRDNNRYGETLKLLDQQDEINKRRSRLLHMANQRQTMSQKGAVESVAALKRELSKPDGHVEYEQMDDTGRPSFQIIPTNDMATSQFALLQEAKQSIQGMGATEALQGATEGESGRAVLAKQQGAMQGLTPLNDKLHNFTKRVFEAMWQRVRQFWTEEKWIRVTDDERNVKFVSLNRPVTLMEELQQRPPEEVQQFALQNGLVPNDPRLGQVVRVENPIEELDVDIIMEEVPDQVTLDAENFQQLVDIDASRGGILPIEMLIEASPLRSSIKTKIIEFFEEQKQQQAQAGQPDPIQQQAMQLEFAEKQAGIENTQAQTQKYVTDAQRNMAETQRAAMGL